MSLLSQRSQLRRTKSDDAQSRKSNLHLQWLEVRQLLSGDDLFSGNDNDDVHYVGTLSLDKSMRTDPALAT
ncbi:MAG: hypothetical protein WBD20_08890 [Pirellulaceae bacterium]